MTQKKAEKEKPPFKTDWQLLTIDYTCPKCKWNIKDSPLNARAVTQNSIIIHLLEHIMGADILEK